MSYYAATIGDDGMEVPIAGFFDTAPKAAKMAKTLSASKGIKILPKRLAQAPDWRERMRKRVAEGKLTALPAKWDLEPIPDHFAHRPSSDLMKIAFIENHEKGVLDKPTLLAPGRYLEVYYPNLSINERKAYVAHFNEVEVFFATTPEKIVEIYETASVTSCMVDKGRKNFVTPVHPVHVYGAGDLAVAYTLGKSGNIAERCVCWPEAKVYSGVYSDGSHKLRKGLEERGFRQIDDASDFIGARLLRVLFEYNGARYFVCPYIDMGGSVMLEDDGEFLRFVTPSRSRVLNGTGGSSGMTSARQIATTPSIKKAAA